MTRLLAHTDMILSLFFLDMANDFNIFTVLTFNSYIYQVSSLPIHINQSVSDDTGSTRLK